MTLFYILSSQHYPYTKICLVGNVVPVRQQIAWAKAYKRLMKIQSQGGSSLGKKFTKERTAKVAEEEYVEIDYAETKPPAIFVDGYNVIGYINSVENRNIDLSDARDCLISDLSVLCGATGWWIELVFDAYDVGANTVSEDIVDQVHVSYTSRSETADNLIERRFSELKNLVIPCMTSYNCRSHTKYLSISLPHSYAIRVLRI